MKTIAILGGAGAMGAMFGARLAMGGATVTLIDVNRAALDRITREGVVLEEKSGERHRVAVSATDDPAAAGAQDAVLVFTKCYHTEAAVRGALPLIGPATTVASLQNGWGNASRIQSIIGADRVVAGVTYNSGALLGPGHTLQGGVGPTFVGEIDGGVSRRVDALVDALRAGGFETIASPGVRDEIWKKLALNVCTLPTAGIFTWEARKLIEARGMTELMAALLRETVAVATAQGIALDFDERWEAITGLLARIAPSLKGSMPTDIAHKRQTEIDVINGAIVDAGERCGIPTPHNATMVWLVKALESMYGR
jgi:2-dehydropantoate 2-reductase